MTSLGRSECGQTTKWNLEIDFDTLNTITRQMLQHFLLLLELTVHGSHTTKRLVELS